VSAPALEHPSPFPWTQLKLQYLVGRYLTTLCLLSSGPPGPRGHQGIVELTSNTTWGGGVWKELTRKTFEIGSAFGPHEQK
jgi:hypothetical protein